MHIERCHNLSSLHTYAQAQMIVNNPEAYKRKEVLKAVSLILSNLTARPDDVTAAIMAA